MAEYNYEFNYRITTNLPEDIVKLLESGDVTEDEVKSVIRNEMAENLKRQFKAELEDGLILRGTAPVIAVGSMRRHRRTTDAVILFSSTKEKQ